MPKVTNEINYVPAYKLNLTEYYKFKYSTFKNSSLQCNYFRMIFALPSFFVHNYMSSWNSIYHTIYGRWNFMFTAIDIHFSHDIDQAQASLYLANFIIYFDGTMHLILLNFRHGPNNTFCR